MPNRQYTDQDSERALLWSILKGTANRELIRKIDFRDFTGILERRIARAIKNLEARGEPIDLLTVTASLTPTVSPETMSEFADDAEMLQSTEAPVTLHARLLELRRKRELDDVLWTFQEKLPQASDVDCYREKLEKALCEAAFETKRESGRPISEVLGWAVSRLHDFHQGDTTMSTGWRLLDEAVGGWAKGDLTVLEAASEVDRALLSIVVAIWGAKAHGRTMLVTEPLDSTHMALRLIMATTEVPISPVVNGIAIEHWAEVAKAVTAVAGLPLVLADPRDVLRFFRNIHFRDETVPKLVVVLLAAPLDSARAAAFGEMVHKFQTTWVVISPAESSHSVAWFTDVSFSWFRVAAVTDHTMRFRMVADRFARKADVEIELLAP